MPLQPSSSELRAWPGNQPTANPKQNHTKPCAAIQPLKPTRCPTDQLSSDPFTAPYGPHSHLIHQPSSQIQIGTSLQARQSWARAASQPGSPGAAAQPQGVTDYFNLGEKSGKTKSEMHPLLFLHHKWLNRKAMWAFKNRDWYGTGEERSPTRKRMLELVFISP